MHLFLSRSSVRSCPGHACFFACDLVETSADLKAFGYHVLDICQYLSDLGAFWKKQRCVVRLCAHRDRTGNFGHVERMHGSRRTDFVRTDDKDPVVFEKEVEKYSTKG